MYTKGLIMFDKIKPYFTDNRLVTFLRNWGSIMLLIVILSLLSVDAWNRNKQDKKLAASELKTEICLDNIKEPDSKKFKPQPQPSNWKPSDKDKPKSTDADKDTKSDANTKPEKQDEPVNDTASKPINLSNFEVPKADYGFVPSRKETPVETARESWDRHPVPPMRP